MVSSVLNETGQLLGSLDDSPFIIRFVGKVFSKYSLRMGGSIRKAIYEHGIKNNEMFYYEVDGFGNGYFMDDAN